MQHLFMIPIFNIVFYVSALGPLTVMLSLGFTSLSGAISALIPIISVLIYFLKPLIHKSIISVYIYIGSFLIFSVSALILFNQKSIWHVGNENIIWLGMFAIILASLSNVDELILYLPKLDKLVQKSTYIYMLSLMYISLLYHHGPAMALVGIIYFGYYLVEMRNGSIKSIIILLFIFIFQFLLSARIVLVAEGIMLLLSYRLSFNYNHDFTKNNFKNIIISACILSSVFLLILLGVKNKSLSDSGDAGVTVGEVSINTSGRALMWIKVLDSAFKSPWFGNGSSVPIDMIDSPNWSHPHNDYLRLFHYSGIFGLFLWLLFIINILKLSLRTAKNTQIIQYKTWCYTTYLTTIGILICMITDNVITYSYVMYPFSIMISMVLALSVKSLKKAIENVLDASDYGQTINAGSEIHNVPTLL